MLAPLPGIKPVVYDIGGTTIHHIKGQEFSRVGYVEVALDRSYRIKTRVFVQASHSVMIRVVAQSRQCGELMLFEEMLVVTAEYLVVCKIHGKSVSHTGNYCLLCHNDDWISRDSWGLTFVSPRYQLDSLVIYARPLDSSATLKRLMIEQTLDF